MKCCITVKNRYIWLFMFSGHQFQVTLDLLMKKYLALLLIQIMEWSLSLYPMVFVDFRHVSCQSIVDPAVFSLLSQSFDYLSSDVLFIRSVGKNLNNHWSGKMFLILMGEFTIVNFYLNGSMIV